jgi:hypothetical protein
MRPWQPAAVDVWVVAHSAVLAPGPHPGLLPGKQSSQLLVPACVELWPVLDACPWYLVAPAAVQAMVFQAQHHGQLVPLLESTAGELCGFQKRPT